MSKELHMRLGNIELYKYRYPKGKGSKLIMELESLEAVSAISERKFLGELRSPEGIYKLQQAVRENVHVEWSRWSHIGPATVRVLCNGNEGWKSVAEYVVQQWKDTGALSSMSSRIEEILLHHLFRSWDVRGDEIFAVPIADGLSMEENLKAVAGLMGRRVISMNVSGIRWCKRYLEDVRKRLNTRYTTAGTICEEDLYRRSKIESYFVLAENPELRTRIGFPVL